MSKQKTNNENKLAFYRFVRNTWIVGVSFLMLITSFVATLVFYINLPLGQWIEWVSYSTTMSFLLVSLIGGDKVMSHFNKKIGK